MLGGLTVTGSIVGTHQDVVDVFELHRRGKTRVERQDAHLEGVNEAIEAVLDGSAGAPHTVFQMGHATARPGDRRLSSAAAAG